MRKIYCFHHSDLDGMGVKIVSLQYAASLGVECETHKCNYNDVNQIVVETLSDTSIENVQEIIIADISVNEETAEYLENLYQLGIKIRLRDHHESAEWLNKYSWAKVTEKVNNTLRCGTYLLALDPDIASACEPITTFIDMVDSYDTWKWKAKNQICACKLNSLFQILGEEDFTNYIMSLQSPETPEDLFTSYADTLIEANERLIKKIANNCKKSMYTMMLELPRKPERYKTGVVFCNQFISNVADIILSEHPEIDILMLMSFPKTISFRTKKNLNVPLGDVAKLITGSGGGHPMSAGATISDKQFKKLFERSFSTLTDKRVKWTSLNMEECDNEG